MDPFKEILSGPSGMDGFYGAYLLKKGHFVGLYNYKDAIFDHFYFFKTQGSRLGATVAPSKALE